MKLKNLYTVHTYITRALSCADMHLLHTKSCIEQSNWEWQVVSGPVINPLFLLNIFYCQRMSRQGVMYLNTYLVLLQVKISQKLHCVSFAAVPNCRLVFFPFLADVDVSGCKTYGVWLVLYKQKYIILRPPLFLGVLALNFYMAGHFCL